MCEICDTMNSFFDGKKTNPGITGFGQPPISLYNMNNGPYWRAKISSDQPPAPEQETDADDLSSEGRDVIGLVRTTVKVGQGETITDLSIFLLCAVHGVPADEWDDVQKLAAAIKKDTPTGKPEEIMMKAFMEAFISR